MANPTHEVRSNDSSGATATKSDMKLEVVVIPVSDVDRAREFYKKVGWRLDVTPPTVVQLTPPGSWCSVQFGKTLTSAAPGSAKSYLIVSDVVAARNQLVAAGIEVGEFLHFGPEGRGGGGDPERKAYRSRASFSDPDGNVWLLQEVTGPATRARRLWRDIVQFGGRLVERASACLCRSWRAREARRRGRSELARLVRRVHGAGADRRRASARNDHDATAIGGAACFQQALI
jgi:catechol 2,3-dioxygenase-like lactoylglutathione lyase family enzyme